VGGVVGIAEVVREVVVGAGVVGAVVVRAAAREFVVRTLLLSGSR
jgi:hypothetical protein